MIPIRYLRGDATCPQARGIKIIAHVCNDLGGWGKGFVLALSRRWREPEEAYRRWAKDREGFGLGKVQFVQVDPHLWVANMVAQRGMRAGSQGPPIRYEALEACLQQVAREALEKKASVHMPRIGCGLAGGKWEMVEPILIRTLCDKDLEVTVYDHS
jgi:O-acetyl-ADP-ribose deacetylase (regulator of RNase III)